jgi:hypothetical protein
MTQIDLTTDQLRPVAQVAADCTGRRPSPASVWRWTRKGTRGGRLEAYYVHGVWCTTPEAFADFIRRQTDAALATPAADEPDDEQLRAAGLL